MYRCVEPFATFRDGIPEVYGATAEVLEGDPILKSHRAHFEPVSDRVLRRARVEQATAAPGELRSPVVPVASAPVVVVPDVVKEYEHG